jgi:hypothetical protein
MKTHYETLSVGEDATEDDIKAAYKRRAHECHPDRHGGNLAAEEAFKNLGAAYGVLRDSSKRASYDLELKLRRAEAAEARRPTPAPSWSPPRPAPAPVPRWAPPPSGGTGLRGAAGPGLGLRLRDLPLLHVPRRRSRRSDGRGRTRRRPLGSRRWALPRSLRTLQPQVTTVRRPPRTSGAKKRAGHALRVVHAPALLPMRYPVRFGLGSTKRRRVVTGFLVRLESTCRWFDSAPGA